MSKDRKVVPQTVSKKEIIKLKSGKFFPTQMLMVGYLLGLISISTIIFGSAIWGVVTFLFCVLIVIAPDGIQLDPLNQTYRKYPITFFTKYGWKSLENYPDITILSRDISQTLNSAKTMGNSTTFTDRYHDIFLLTKSHRKKLFIKRFENVDEAKIELRFFAEKLDKKVAKYNPVISGKTQVRRGGRR